MKKILKILFIILIFVFLYSTLSLLLVRKGNGYGTDILNFYNQDRNSIDILTLGSSHDYAAFNPDIIYDNTNYKTYNFATQQQPIWITYYYFKEALKYQKPKYVFLEVHMAVVTDYEYASESVNRDAIDKMRLSFNKIEAINSSVEKLDDRWSYYFNIFKYHSRYKELSYNDIATVFLNKTVDNNGYIALKNENYIFEYNKVDTEETIKIDDKNILYLNKIVDLAYENNIKIIFLKTPCWYNDIEIKKLNYIKSYTNNNDILFLNFINNIQLLNLDYKKDFFDSGHLSESGSEKFSEKISDIINDLEVQND